MKRRLATVLVCGILAACGGGGGGEGATTAGVSNSPGTGLGARPAGTTGGSTDGTAGSIPPAPIVTASTAPAEGASLAGTLTLRIDGQNIGNAELLPASGHAPQLGRFTVAPDGRSASLSFDTATVPNGPLSVRIAAWNLPAGSSGATEIVAMPARTWVFANSPSPAGTDAGRTARCQQMGYTSTPVEPGNPVVCITAMPTSTPVAQCTRFGTGYGNPEDLLEVLRNGSRISKLYCQPGANGGVLNEGCHCLS